MSRAEGSSGALGSGLYSDVLATQSHAISAGSSHVCQRLPIIIPCIANPAFTHDAIVQYGVDVGNRANLIDGNVEEADV